MGDMPMEDWPIFEIQLENGPRDLVVTTWAGPVARVDGPPIFLQTPVFRKEYAYLASAHSPDDPLVENAVQTHVYVRVGPSPWDPNRWIYEWDERRSETVVAHDEGAGL